MIYDLLELVLLVVIFLGILALAYFATRKMAMMNKRMAFNKNMEVIEVLQLTQGNYLYIIKVGKEYHLMGSTQKGNICYCQRIDEEQLDLEKVVQPSFEAYFKHFMKGKLVKENDKEHDKE